MPKTMPAPNEVLGIVSHNFYTKFNVFIVIYNFKSAEKVTRLDKCVRFLRLSVASHQEI